MAARKRTRGHASRRPLRGLIPPNGFWEAGDVANPWSAFEESKQRVRSTLAASLKSFHKKRGFSSEGACNRSGTSSAKAHPIESIWGESEIWQTPEQLSRHPRTKQYIRSQFAPSPQNFPKETWFPLRVSDSSIHRLKQIPRGLHWENNADRQDFPSPKG